MLKATDFENVFFSRCCCQFPLLSPLPYLLTFCSSSRLTAPPLSAVHSDPWTAACRSPTGRGFPMLSTAACGGGRTSTATTSCAPSRPVSMPSTSRRTRSASTPTTIRGWRPQVSALSYLKTYSCACVRRPLLFFSFFYGSHTLFYRCDTSF